MRFPACALVCAAIVVFPFKKYLSMEREAGAPTHALAQWRLGLLFELQNRKPEAIAAMEDAVKADPSLEQAKKDLKRLKG